jgi:predicted PhzF superfamily epimerase YddE/YHI9
MRHCYVLRVFTRDGMGGNHLGVVTDVSGLTERVMQQVAADLGFSETIFIDWSDPVMPTTRIFTPAAELPFAGHPLVGAAWVLNTLGPGGVDRIGCVQGEVVIDVDGETVWIEAPAHPRPVGPCSLDLDGWVVPISAHTVEMPLPYHEIEVATPSEVGSARTPDLEGEIHLWSWSEPGAAVKARFFAPQVGVAEDPATGSAAVALAARLSASGMTTGSIRVDQGDEVGAPSTIQLRWDERATRIGGTVSRDDVRVLDV